MTPAFRHEWLKDGTLKVWNPLVGEDVWTVPGRSGRPITNVRDWDATPLGFGRRHEKSCNFCPENLIHTPAEKSRLVLEDGRVRKLERLLPAQARATQPLFRRVPNLYEIVPFEYWKANHGRELSPRQRRNKEAYLADAQGRDHLKKVLGEKLARLGMGPDEILDMGERVFDHADSFFGGSHDLIIAGDHYRRGGETTEDLLSSGHLSPEDHLRFVDYALEAARELGEESPQVAHVSVYQNWRSSAGASFDHLHKQVLGIDCVPAGLQIRLKVLKDSPDFFNREILALARREGLGIAENERAVALSEPGHVFPCVAVYSKAASSRWEDLSAVQRRGFSDLLWACHHLAGSRLAVNEEWYQAGADGPAMPLHALVKWRMNIPAGFEGAARIFLAPLFPRQVCERLLGPDRPPLPDTRWGADCALEEGSLSCGK